jgi:hypothetical protein
MVNAGIECGRYRVDEQEVGSIPLDLRVQDLVPLNIRV